ncbi:MAG: hypothetical protein QXX51_01315 [Candidatus Bathyarchaeia archaeon]
MIKEKEVSGNAKGKQVDLFGQEIEKLKSQKETEEQSLLKSALQKSIRKGLSAKAMYYALKLAEQNWYMAWRRLRVIADEDVGQPWAINAVETLYRKFLEFKGRGEKELSWDCKRCICLAALILAEAPKDRRADEFLELIDTARKYPENMELRNIMVNLEEIPNEAFDMHTVEGRRRGRGLRFWYEVSSECANKKPEYETWRRTFFKPLMLKVLTELEKKKSEKLNTNVQRLEGVINS